MKIRAPPLFSSPPPPTPLSFFSATSPFTPDYSHLKHTTIQRSNCLALTAGAPRDPSVESRRLFLSAITGQISPAPTGQLTVEGAGGRGGGAGGGGWLVVIYRHVFSFRLSDPRDHLPFLPKQAGLCPLVEIGLAPPASALPLARSVFSITLMN